MAAILEFYSEFSTPNFEALLPRIPGTIVDSVTVLGAYIKGSYSDDGYVLIITMTCR